MFNESEAEAYDEGSTPTLSHLWQIVKDSDSHAKLILPDLLTNPFYLPAPKATKEIKDAKFERELRRLNFICDQESKIVRPSNRSNVMASIPNYNLIGKELAIAKRLVDPYRRDTEKREKLMAQFAEVQAKTEEQSADLKPKLKAPAPRKPSVSSEVRQSIVIHRRTTMLETVQESAELYAQRMEEKRLKAIETQLAQAALIAEQRVFRWAQVVSALGAMRVMFNIVHASRKKKAQSPKQWEAVMRIQRWYRKIRFYGHRSFKNVRMSVKVNAIVKMMKANVANVNSLANRQAACTVITTFLVALQGRFSVLVKKYVSNIKSLQVRLKSHFCVTQMRMVLIERLFEVCMPALLVHMDLVIQGRGHDIGNLTAYDLNRIGALNKASGRFRLVQHMNSVNFHAYLRNHLPQIPMVLSIFKIVIGKVSKEVEVAKEYEFFELLQRKRKQHILNLAVVKIKRLVIPKFSISHIREFIHGGEDPLNTILVAAQEEDDRSHAAHEAARRLKVGSLSHSKNRKAVAAANSRRLCLLLQMVEAEDICMLAMNVAAKSIDPRSLLAQRNTKSNQQIRNTASTATMSNSFDSESRPQSGRGIDIRSNASREQQRSRENVLSARGQRKSIDIQHFSPRMSEEFRPSTPPRRPSVVSASPHKARRSSVISSTAKK